MKSLLTNGFTIIGTVGLFSGYPILAYITGVFVIWEHITEVAKGAQTSTATFWLAVMGGLILASNSSFSWWQGILIGFTIEGLFMLLILGVVFLASFKKIR